MVRSIHTSEEISYIYVMSSKIPECRKYPWLFIPNRIIPEDDRWLCLRGQNSRPFRDSNITHQDVISLINQGYELTEIDRTNIATKMNIEEILSLWEHYPVKLKGDLLRSNSSYNLKYQAQLHREECTLDSKFIDSSVWHIEIISRYVDVSIILNNPQIPWYRTSMSWNRTVTLEHTPLIDSGNATGNWIMGDMLDRSPIHLCIPYVNNRNIHTLASNPNLTLDDAITILETYRDYVDRSTGFWDELSRSLHIDDIIKLDGVVQCNWTKRIWWNPSITSDNIDRVRALMGDPLRSLYYGCNLDNVTQDEWMRVSWDDQIGISTHPRCLKYLNKMRYADPIMKNIILNSDIDLIEEHVENVHFIDLLLMRQDLTPKLLQIVQDNLTGVSYGSWNYPEMERACELHPDRLIDLFSKRLTASKLAYCRWLDVTRLHEYDIECYPPREFFCSMDEVEDDMSFSLLSQNNKLTYSKVQDLLTRGVITLEDIEDNWDNIQRNLRVEDLPKFNLPICKRTMYRRINMSDCSGSGVQYALSMGLSDIITSYTSGLTIELADRLGIQLVYQVLTLDQLCIRGLDLVSMENMYHIPMRFRLLHRLGNTSCIVNCFKTIPFSNRSLKTYSDIDIICN